jgi:hypothetical protein
VIWRTTIVAGYVALAVLVGIAYGGRGLAVLLFFYLWAGAWAGFLLVWGWAARAAGRWNVRRLERPRPDGGSSNGLGGRLGEPLEPDPAATPDRVPAGDAARRRPAPAL